MNKKFFISCILIAVLTGIHFIPCKSHVISGAAYIPHDAYGLAFTTMPPKKSKRVIFLGNSVFQATQVVPFINDLKSQTGLDFEIGNFSITGATIADYLVTYNYIKKFHPDLLIIHLHPVTFGYSYPFYRHASRKLIFTPEMKNLRQPLILNTFSNNELAESVLYSYFPIYRTLPLLRHKLKKKLNHFFVKYLHLPVMNFFPYSLDPGKDWEILNVQSKVGNFEFPLSKPFLRFFINQLEVDHQKAVFIMQETSNESLPMFEELPAFFKGKKYCVLYDFRNFYEARNYKDAVHPDDTGALKSALRIMEVIERNLN
jgi:hypothetical protein